MLPGGHFRPSVTWKSGSQGRTCDAVVYEPSVELPLHGARRAGDSADLQLHLDPHGSGPITVRHGQAGVHFRLSAGQTVPALRRDETKTAFKTTEFTVYVVAVIGVLIASFLHYFSRSFNALRYACDVSRIKSACVDTSFSTQSEPRSLAASSSSLSTPSNIFSYASSQMRPFCFAQLEHALTRLFDSLRGRLDIRGEVRRLRGDVRRSWCLRCGLLSGCLHRGLLSGCLRRGLLWAFAAFLAPSPRPSWRVPSPRPSWRVPSPRPSWRVPSPRPSWRVPSPRPSWRVPSPRPS